MGITLDQLVYDASNPDDGANVGAYLKDGSGNAITSTGGALDVNFTAVDLDIRDLDASQDNVAISDGTDTLAIAADGSIAVTDNGGSLTVDATDLDIRDLDFSTDSVTSRLQDGSGNAIGSTAGSLDVNITSGVNVEVDLDHADDSVRLGDGTTLTDVTADNRLETFHAPDTAAQNSTTTVGTSAVELAATPLANRKKIVIQNNGSKAIYIGATGVTTATGICIPRGASYSEDWGPSVDVFAISGTAGQDVRVMEVA